MIEPNLAPTNDVRVKVLHGVRNVGKTALAQHLCEIDQYDDFVTLADSRTLRLAQNDPRGWLASLSPRSVIDEAQLLSQLPLELKWLVDQVDTNRHFLLTGSASICRTGLGGTDPLAGRAQTWTLMSLTPVELEGRPEDARLAINQLMGDPPVSEWEIVASTDAVKSMSRGGLPPLVLGPFEQPARDRWVRDFIASVLTDQVLPDERFDRGRAQQVLDACLLRTGSILNVTNIASEVGLNQRTIDRYLDILEQRFLVWFLPNIALSGVRQTRTRAKVFPVDSSFASESLGRAFPKAISNPDIAGHIWESYVINVIRAMASTTNPDMKLYFWRAPKGEYEVDLVLVDSIGRTVGLEVKLSTSVSLNDARGLNAMVKGGLAHAGYVVYNGNRMVRLTDCIWAVPFDALAVSWNQPHTVLPAPKSVQDVLEDAMVPDARVFVSYVHADDEYLNGAMTAFVTALEKAYEFLYARKLQVFLDRTSIKWGQAWSEAIDDAVQKTDFFLALVTPSYLRNKACRDEINSFNATHHVDGLLLSLIWVPIEVSSATSEDDPVVTLIREHQYENGQLLTRLDPASMDFRLEVERLAEQLHKTISEREQIATDVLSMVDTGADRGSGDDVSGLLDDLMELETKVNVLNSTADQFIIAFQALATEFETIDPNRLQGSSMISELASFKHRADPLAVNLESFSSLMGKEWQNILELIEIMIVKAGDVGLGEDITRQVCDMLVQVSGMIIGDQDNVINLIHQLGTMSRFLRPTSRSIGAALRTIDGIRDSARSWLNQMGR